MLDRLELQDGLVAATPNRGADRHADLDLGRCHADDRAHQSDALGKVDQNDCVRIDRWLRVNDRDRMDCTLSGRCYPLPVAIARSWLGDSRGKEETPAGTRSLQAEFTSAESFPPLLFRSHPSDLWNPG